MTQNRCRFAAFLLVCVLSLTFFHSCFVSMTEQSAPSHTIDTQFCWTTSLIPAMNILADKPLVLLPAISSITARSNRTYFRFVLTAFAAHITMPSLVCILSTLVLCTVFSSTLHMIQYIHRKDGKIRPCFSL